MTQATGFTSRILVSMEDEHRLKRHTFDYEEAGRSGAVSLQARWRSEKERCFADVAVVNKLPHMIPTGEFGFRKGLLLLKGKTESGDTVATEEFELYKETKTALVPMEERVFGFSLPIEATRIEVTLLREGDDETRRFIIATAAFIKPEAAR